MKGRPASFRKSARAPTVEAHTTASPSTDSARRIMAGILAQPGVTNGARMGLIVAREGPLGDEMIGDGPAADEVFLNDPLEHRRIALAVPRAFRINDGDRAGLADAEAVRLRAEHAVVGQTELDETPLQIVPRHD